MKINNKKMPTITVASRTVGGFCAAQFSLCQAARIVAASLIVCLLTCFACACNGISTPVEKVYAEGETRTTSLIVRVNFKMNEDVSSDSYDSITKVTLVYGDKNYEMTAIKAERGYSFKVSASIVSTTKNGSAKFIAHYQEIGGKENYDREYEITLLLDGKKSSPSFDFIMPISQVGA